MASTDTLRRVIEKGIKKAYERRNPPSRSGFVGWADGSVVDDARPNYIKIRTADGQEFEAWNENVAPVLNTRIDYAPDPEYPGLLRARQPRLAFTQDFPFVALKFHRANHAWPGPDTVPVEMRQFMPLHPSISGFVLTVRAGWVKTSTGWHYRDAETVDLSGDIPASGALYILFTIDDTGALIQTDGAPVSAIFALTLTNMPALPPGHTPLCAIRLYAGQTVIKDEATNTDLIDLRFTAFGSTGQIVNVDYIEFDTGYTPTGLEPTGTTYWDDDNHCLTTVYEWGTKLQHGFELYKIGTDEGNDWKEGAAVSVMGATGNRVAFALTDASPDSTNYSDYVGLLTTAPDSGNRVATREGAVNALDTTGAAYNVTTNPVGMTYAGETWAEGNKVYVDPAHDGFLTNVEPTAPNKLIQVGTVTIVHATEGQIELLRRVGFDISQLNDVSESAPSDGDVLRWDDSAGYFSPRPYNEVASADGFYFGDADTDGTWRIIRDGNNLIMQRRESGSYVTKQTISA